jgi:hypothetical protein
MSDWNVNFTAPNDGVSETVKRWYQMMFSQPEPQKSITDRVALIKGYMKMAKLTYDVCETQQFGTLIVRLSRTYGCPLSEMIPYDLYVDSMTYICDFDTMQVGTIDE